MTSFKTYPQPPNHKTLRAILALINSATERGDIESLRHVSEILYDNLPALSVEDNKNLTVLIHGNIDKINNSTYKMFTDKDIEEVSATLQKHAYGDFSEALHLLAQDLRSLDLTIKRESNSDIFKPDFFTPEEQEVWSLLRKPLSDFNANPNVEAINSAKIALDKLRLHQQSFYGPLIPTISASYLKKPEHPEDNTTGVTVVLAYDDPAIIVNTFAPFATELDEYIINKLPLDSDQDFNANMLPKSIGGYNLVDHHSENLFMYEIKTAQ